MKNNLHFNGAAGRAYDVNFPTRSDIPNFLDSSPQGLYPQSNVTQGLAGTDCAPLSFCRRVTAALLRFFPPHTSPQLGGREHLWQCNKKSTLRNLGEPSCLKRTVRLNVNWRGKGALCNSAWMTNGWLSKVNKQGNASEKQTKPPF